MYIAAIGSSTHHGASTTNLADVTEVNGRVACIVRLLPRKLTQTSDRSSLLSNVVSNHLLLGAIVAASVGEGSGAWGVGWGRGNWSDCLRDDT